jgi:IgA peptidase M64/VCBS repeat protein
VPDSMTQILASGPPGTKKNIAVLGDGFAGGADQTLYNDKVKELLLDGVFGHDYFYEDAQAFNVYRVNLISNQSPVSTRTYDEKGTPTDPSDDTVASESIRDTALGYIFSGSWAHCWLEGGPNTGTLVQNALDTWVPDYDLVLIILNDARYGGCGGGGFQIVPLGVDWPVMAHEFGHGTGGLADEYCASPGGWSGGEPGVVNLTTNTNRATLKWGNFVAPSTPLPTGTGACADYTAAPKPPGWSDDQDVGLFEGGGTVSLGVYRPVVNCRMRGNAPPYCPVCYTQMKRTMDPYTGRTFLKAYAGDFNGDGRDDVLVHNDNSIIIYRSNGSQLDVAFSAVERVPGSWQFKPDDQFFVGDFNGDGKDEVAVYNSTNWAIEYLGLLAEDGAGGLKLIARYDDGLPGWQFQRGDRHVVGDFTGNGREDLWVFNGGDWSLAYLGLLRSTGTGLTMSHRYDGSMPGWQMRRNDHHVVGDFDADGKADLYVFNGHDWSIAYLGMLRSTGSALAMTKRYDGNVPGWQMRRNDKYYRADVDGNGRADLFVFNSQDWYSEYLGTVRSNGSALAANWAVDWVGEWNLGSVDRFEPCDYEGVGGRRDLFVHNTDWFGMIRATPGLSLDRLYYRWIHNYNYGRNW